MPAEPAPTRTTRWSLRDDLSFCLRYLLLGLVVGGVAGILLAARLGDGATAVAGLAVAGLAILCCVRLAHRHGRAWEALLLACATGVVAVSPAQPVGFLALLPLPWLALRPLRFPGRLALAVVQAASAAMLVSRALRVDNPLVALPALGAGVGWFLWRWQRLEGGPRRRFVAGTLRFALGALTALLLTVLVAVGEAAPFLVLACAVGATLWPRLLPRPARRAGVDSSRAHAQTPKKPAQAAAAT